MILGARRSVQWTLGFCSKEVIDHLARYSLTLSTFYRAELVAMSRKGLLEDLHGLCEDVRIVRTSCDMFRSEFVPGLSTWQDCITVHMYAHVNIVWMEKETARERGSAQGHLSEILDPWPSTLISLCRVAVALLDGCTRSSANDELWAAGWWWW